MSERKTVKVDHGYWQVRAQVEQNWSTNFYVPRVIEEITQSILAKRRAEDLEAVLDDEGIVPDNKESYSHFKQNLESLIEDGATDNEIYNHFTTERSEPQ